MVVYRVLATNNDNDHLLPDIDKMPDGLRDRRLKVGPEIMDDWTPPPLFLMRGRKKIDADFWAYDHDLTFVVNEKVAAVLEGELWCRMIPFTTEVMDRKRKPAGELSKHLLVITGMVDAVDRTRTRFNPYGDEIIDYDQPDSTFFHHDKLPVAGLFLHKSGAATIILCAEDPARPEESFKALFNQMGWTGLEFIPLYQGV